MKEFFTKNIRIKLASLLLALFLEFYFISPSNLVTTALTVPVEVTNVPTNLVVVSPDFSSTVSAEIRLRGPGPLLDQVKQSALRFRLQLPKDVGIERSFPAVVDPGQLSLPSGVSVVDVVPSSFEVRLDRLTRVELPVAPKVEGSPATDFELDSVRVSPQTVALSGPESELRGIKKIETELVDLTGLTEQRVLDLPLRPVGPRTLLTPTIIRAEVVIVPKRSERVFEGVKVQVVGGNGSAARISPSQVRVTLRGGAQELKKISPESLKLSVSAGELGKGEHEVSLKIPAIEGVSSYTVEPPVAKVVVSSGGG